MENIRADNDVIEKKHGQKDYRFEETVMGEQITAQVLRLDEGIHALITGGEKSHIGAVSYVYPGQPVRTIQFPGHKDGTVSEQWARKLYELLEETVCVECGIHYDGLKREEIEEVVAACNKMLEELICIIWT